MASQSLSLGCVQCHAVMLHVSLMFHPFVGLMRLPHASAHTCTMNHQLRSGATPQLKKQFEEFKRLHALDYELYDFVKVSWRWNTSHSPRSHLRWVCKHSLLRVLVNLTGTPEVEVRTR